MDLARYHQTDAAIHARALAEITRGRKESHWMWFVFPQLAGLGRSPTAIHYGMQPDETAGFLADPVLGPRLIGMCRAVMLHAGKQSAEQIFGPVDAQKLCSAMTLSASVRGAVPVFAEVLAAFCDGPCQATLAILEGAAGRQS